MSETTKQTETTQSEPNRPIRRWLLLAAIPVLLHLCVLPPDEPVYNGDANRHVMTSVFFRDLLVDRPLDAPREYADAYYQQYPALGLLVWPPLFHGICGVLMTVFGTSVWVSRVFVFATFLVAAWSLYKLVRRRVSAQQAKTVVLLFSIMPMVFEFSRFVMLEMLTMALCLVCIERFDIWLREQRHRNLYIAAASAAFAALTRFDAVVLLPTLLLFTLFEGRWKQLFTWHVPAATLLAIILIGPTYAVIWKEMGDLHLRQAVESVSAKSIEPATLGRIPFYPLCLPFQAGWTATVLLLIGLMAGITRPHRAAATVFAALLIGTYITFTPLAELRSRHTIYWLPAIAYFASVGATVLAAGIRRVTAWTEEQTTSLAFALLVCCTAYTTFNIEPHRVTGYSDAATTAIEHSGAGDRILIDGWWDGNITYHLRHLDETRSRHVVRANKLMYDFINVPSVDFEAFVESDRDILQIVVDSEATCMILESPQPFGQVELSEQLLALVSSLPLQFPLLETIPVDVAFPGAQAFELKVYSVNHKQLQAYLNDANSSANVSSLTP